MVAAGYVAVTGVTAAGIPSLLIGASVGGAILLAGGAVAYVIIRAVDRSDHTRCV